MKLRWLLPSLALAFLSAHASAAALNPGDAAPALKVGKWMKGDAVEKLEPGQVYVVEFWATWCGPCRTSIPHLTELTTKFAGKATFIGVSVFEREKTDEERFKKVGDFVTEMGSKMDYRVAADAADKAMATNWMEASGERGIPTAFIVDKEGKIAWIGHPMGDLEKTLDAVVEAKWDAKAFAAGRTMARAADEEEQKLMTPILKLARENKPKEAIEALDKVIAEHADYAEKTGFFRFSLLVKSDEPQPTHSRSNSPMALSRMNRRGSRRSRG